MLVLPRVMSRPVRAASACATRSSDRVTPPTTKVRIRLPGPCTSGLHLVDPASRCQPLRSHIMASCHASRVPHRTGVPMKDSTAKALLARPVAPDVTLQTHAAEMTTHRKLHPEHRILRTRPVKPVESGSPLAAADAAAALDWARFAQAGRLRTLKLPGRLLKLDSDCVTEPAHGKPGISKKPGISGGRGAGTGNLAIRGRASVRGVLLQSSERVGTFCGDMNFAKGGEDTMPDSSNPHPPSGRLSWADLNQCRGTKGSAHSVLSSAAGAAHTGTPRRTTARR